MIIDVHHHWMPREHVDNLKRYLRPGETMVPRNKAWGIIANGRNLFSPSPLYYSMEEQLRDMDIAGIDMSVLSISCWLEWVDLSMSRFINNDMAEVQAKYSERFIGLAHVPIFEEGAMEELERAIKTLKLKGVCITTNTKGKYPDAPEFRPFLKKVNELDVPVVVHAATAPEGEEVRKTVFDSVIGRPLLARGLDHSLFVVRTLLSHVLDDFPRVRFINGHLGGALYFADKGRSGFDQQEYRKYDSQLYFDTAPVTWNRLSLTFATASHGVEHMMMGSDYPVVAPDAAGLKRGIDAINELDLTAQEKKLILGENAARIFRIKR